MYGSALTIFCLCFIPMITPQSKDATHFCSSCRIRLATWYSSPQIIDVDVDSRTRDILSGPIIARSPLGNPQLTRSPRRSILARLQFSCIHSGATGVSWRITSEAGSFTAQGHVPGTEALTQDFSPSRFEDYTPVSADIQILAGDGRPVGDVSYAPRCWDCRLRLERPSLQQRRVVIMRQPALQSVKTVAGFESTRGLVRWEMFRFVRGMKRGRPLVDRWGRVCAYFVPTTRPVFSGELVVMTPVEEEEGEAEEGFGAWIEEVIVATIAVLPQEIRRQKFYNRVFPGSHDYS